MGKDRALLRLEVNEPPPSPQTCQSGGWARAWYTIVVLCVYGSINHQEYARVRRKEEEEDSCF